MPENALVELEDWDTAQSSANINDAATVHRKLNQMAGQFYTVIDVFRAVYHWGLMQMKHANDIVFHHQKDLKAIYEKLERTTVHSVKPENIAPFSTAN